MENHLLSSHFCVVLYSPYVIVTIIYTFGSEGRKIHPDVDIVFLYLFFDNSVIMLFDIVICIFHDSTILFTYRKKRSYHVGWKY